MTTPLFLVNEDNDDAPMFSDELHEGWRMVLPQKVRRHAFGSMRLHNGDELQLSNGEGLRIRAIVSDADQGIVEVQSFETEEAPRTRLALVQALAKTGHDEQAIDMATQIGVDEVIPWQANRSIARWKEGKTNTKWYQTLCAATQQSRRAWLPKLTSMHLSKQLVALCKRACVHGDLVIVLHQDDTTHWTDIEHNVQLLMERCLQDGKERTIYVVVGPEGGISEEEVTLFRDAGAQACVIGTNILRSATAGPVALTLLSRTLGRYL